MKKKELLDMAALSATDEMIAAARADNGHKEEIIHETIWGGDWTENRRTCRYLRYFMAAEEKELLKVAVFVRDSLRAGDRTPKYEIYINKKEESYLTYETAPGKWRKAKINYLEYQGDSWMYCREEWQTQETRDLVNRYFETGKNLNVFQAVLDFQVGRENERRHKKYRAETEQIDATMKEVPDIPEGFRQWVGKNCFRETMFYEPKTRGRKMERMYCTHCETWMDQPGWPDGPEHKKETVCPLCGARAVYRSWNKQKYITEEEEIALLQKMKDRSGYILRLFLAKRKRKHEDGWEQYELQIHEDKREKLSQSFMEQEYFEYGEYRNTGVYRWCHETRRNAYGYYNREITAAIMYTANLKEELADRKFGYMDLEKLFEGGTGKRVAPKNILRMLERYPFLEYLQKSGLTVMTKEILEGKGKEELFDRKMTDIRKALKLDGQRFGRLKQWNGGCSILQALQLEAKSGGKLSDSNIRYIISAKADLDQIEDVMKRTGMKLGPALNYFERQQSLNQWTFGQTNMFYRDYLDMALDRGMDLQDDIVRRQPRMKEYHDRYLEEKNLKKNSERDQEVDLRYQKIRENYERNREHFAFERGNYIFMVPKKASDITREGRLQHHCVGASDNYIDAMDRGKSYIVFLRKKEDPYTPYYTIEVKWDGMVLQWYGAYDRRPDEAGIEKILDRWSREIKKRESEPQKDAANGIRIKSIALQGA